MKKMVSWREYLHAHPELSFQEVNTSAFVASNLEELGIPYQHGIAGTGLVALIKGQNPEKQCIALRADLDALPIHEENEVAYKSKKQYEEELKILKQQYPELKQYLLSQKNRNTLKIS